MFESTKEEEEYITKNQFNNLSITVSVLDPANDYFQFYCKQNDEEIIFSDDGYYINAFLLQDENDFWFLERQGDELILRGKAKNFVFLKNLYIISLLGVLNGKEVY